MVQIMYKCDEILWDDRGNTHVYMHRSITYDLETIPRVHHPVFIFSISSLEHFLRLRKVMEHNQVYDAHTGKWTKQTFEQNIKFKWVKQTR